jgi:hypothetical protein
VKLDSANATEHALRPVIVRRKQVAEAFPLFTVSRAHQHLAPGILTPLAPLFGWHLWVHLTPLG